jgi:leucyl aminopeptidase (aminopeptidase T)
MDIKLIRRLVKASGVKEGELVLVHYWGEEANIEVMHNFAIAIVEIGASPITLQQSRENNSKLFSVSKESSFGDKYFSLFEKVDAVLDVFTYQPVVLNQKLLEEQMKIYQNYMRRLFQILMRASRFTQIRIPTIENAQESNLDPEDYMERMTKAYDIDYVSLQKSCEKRLEELKDAKQIVLHTGENCSLKLTITDREWIADCGDGDLPCGEVYIAPIEEESNGTVFYQKLFLEDVGEFDQVTLTVEQGVVTNSNNESVNEFIQSLPKESRVVCELGFGMNENVTSLCGYTLLDEKMCDTFHIAIGNNTMFGGTNNAEMHMDLVGNARVEVVI